MTAASIVKWFEQSHDGVITVTIRCTLDDGDTLDTDLPNLESIVGMCETADTVVSATRSGGRATVSAKTAGSGASAGLVYHFICKGN